MKTACHPRAFSLVEVTLALAVISFCLLTLVALLPMGLSSTRDSVNKTNAADIASQIAADLRDTPLATNSAIATIPSSPRFGLSMDTNTANATTVNTFYLDDTGNPTGAVGAPITAASLYKATVIIATPKVPATGTAAGTAFSNNKPTTLRVIVTWPAQADQRTGTYPTNYQGYFESVTAVDRN
jgi:uncharacterized protein (TIGR02598 family)